MKRLIRIEGRNRMERDVHSTDKIESTLIEEVPARVVAK